tara:strand:+ start:63 stop:491 length:429 start_codon:yes stop_codon:yes gene_type:complete
MESSKYINHRLNRKEIKREVIPIPEMKVGWIIGKNGCYLKYLRSRTKTSIYFHDNATEEYGISWKYMSVEGLSRNIDKVKKIVHIRLEKLQLKKPEDTSIVDKIGGFSSSNDSQSESIYDIENQNLVIPFDYYYDHGNTEYL